MYRSIRLALAILIVAAAGVAGPARAGEGAVAVELTANRVTKSQGKEVLVPADKAQPGELIEYRALYRNDGKSDARGLMATLPIPLGTQYVPNSALPRGVEASLDGRTFAAVPLKRMEKLPDGRAVEREVPVAEYRALRWPLGALPAKQSRTVTARVRIEPTPVAANTH